MHHCLPTRFDFMCIAEHLQCSYIISGGFDKRLRENVEYLEELKSLAEREGILSRVDFITSCPTAKRNELLSECLCVLYTPKVK